ncbi:adenosylcobinamide-GDP ribazoletransferase [Wohlfahrtiimonas larvae]|uniref:Adenosylcobinamide-GDP ribazoletransferase n=1 Tax=Wohlfahrtiimonas larvae TaxID=1157986 RepID=A0ABP9MTH5_9GAMM|nr:adenosylcobinamide-GDP ribazoletransferase [Wohlfahrtiimonas larvae]
MMFITALIFFTRLPLWRWFSVPSQNFQRVIYYWPFIGWITSGLMISTLLITNNFLPLSITIVLTMISRVILTGALHEDGLGDFLDGFGGGHSKEKILAIMKDSHAGIYAILGLILYFLLTYNIMLSIEYHLLIIFIFITDPFCKMISSLITIRLPYARTIDTSKIQAIYSQPSIKDISATLFFGLLPLFAALWFSLSFWYILAIITPILLFFILTQWMNNKIQGYTGDCAGALFLLLELSMLLTLTAIHTVL